MTPETKAKEIVDKYKGQLKTATPILNRPHYQAKQCAIIHVNGIIDVLNKEIRDIDVAGNILLDLIEKYRNVFNEINKM